MKSCEEYSWTKRLQKRNKRVEKARKARIMRMRGRIRRLKIQRLKERHKNRYLPVVLPNGEKRFVSLFMTRFLKKVGELTQKEWDR